MSPRCGRKPSGAYALAIVAVGVATALRLTLDPYVAGVQFITFAPAIVITTLISGFGAGFFCVVLSTAAMSWTEREGPPVSAPERRGFGSIVMEAMAERSVNGAVDLDYARSGLTWRLTCPAANALES